MVLMCCINLCSIEKRGIHTITQWRIYRGPSRLRPLPLGDGLTPSLTVLLKCDNGTILWRHNRHFYLFKHVKHGTQNIRNSCHQWLSDSFKTNQIRFLPGLRPGPRWRSLQRSFRLPSWFKGAYF